MIRQVFGQRRLCGLWSANDNPYAPYFPDQIDARMRFNARTDRFSQLFKVGRGRRAGVDQKIAGDLLNQLSKLVQSPSCLDHLAKTLENLEENFPTLF